MKSPSHTKPFHLVIFKVNQLGDNVVFLPVVQQLRRLMPEAKITVLTSPVAEPLYSVACHNINTLTFQTAAFNGAWKHPLQLFKIIRNIRKLAPDACMLGDDQANSAHLVARLSGARTSIGPLLRTRPLGFLLHRRVPVTLSDPVALQNWRIAVGLLDTLGTETSSMPPLPPPPDLSAFGSQSAHGIIIHPGASRDYKRWPMARYVQLANRLAAVRPVVWITEEVPEEAELVSGVRCEKPTSLNAFISLMAGAQFFIGNNSGPMNIASALGLKGLIFNGPSTPNWDPPWHGDRLELLRDPSIRCQPCDALTHPVNVCRNVEQLMICMKRWTVDEVTQRVLACTSPV